MSIEHQERPTTARWLEKRGWFRADGGWRHPLLETTWPFWFAVRLQHETDKGAKEPIHRTLREEAW